MHFMHGDVLMMLQIRIPKLSLLKGMAWRNLNNRWLLEAQFDHAQSVQEVWLVSMTFSSTYFDRYQTLWVAQIVFFKSSWMGRARHTTNWSFKIAWLISRDTWEVDEFWLQQKKTKNSKIELQQNQTYWSQSNGVQDSKRTLYLWRLKLI